MSNLNQRMIYGETLVAMGAADPRIVVLDADLGGSTMGKMFENAHPTRHFEMGIAEANMVSVAAGLAQTGKIPFANSFAVFASGRAYDQTRQAVAIGKLNVKIVGSSAGLSDFGDGSTHQSVEDIAIMRAIPNMTVICPADANEAAAATRAIADYNGPVYLRLNRHDYENVTPADKPFEIGKPVVLRDGEEVVIFATGICVGMALEAAEKSGKSVKVVNISTIKPLPQDEIIALASGAKHVVTAEEHSIVGGLGGAIAEALRETGTPIKFVGIRDKFGCSAHGYAELLEHYGITSDAILKEVIS
jgi:transketolase